MKSVLISIQPKWVEKIANGRKTIEVRKSVPKCEVPFKCYIYCTSSDVHSALVVGDGDAKLIHCCNYKSAIPVGGAIGNGKVIGEFVCNWAYYKWECKNRLEISESFPIWRASYMLFVDDLEKTCLTYDDLWKYGKGKPLYGLHISDLKIYDKPKELREFRISCNRKNLCYSCNRFTGKPWDICNNSITRPPQSYMFVEEL